MKKERKTKTRKSLRFTALLLILAVSLTLFPVSGTDTQPTAEPVSTEVLSLREENVKHFAVGNNTYQAVAYGHPVHKLDEDGNWVDIDNSLTLSGSSYATEDGRVSFVQSFTPNQTLMTLQDGDTAVSMALLAELGNQLAAQPMSFASVSNPQNNILTAEDAMNAVFSSSVTYESVLPGTDLEYTVDASSVKEYIVVNAPQSDYAYHFALTLTGLTAQMEEDGSVGLYTEAEEKKYAIPAPYMFDAAGSFSHAVTYTLQGESGKYFLTVTANPQWLNDPSRVWPVKIDPTIANMQAVPKDTYVTVPASAQPHGSDTQMLVNSSCITYVQAPLYTLPSSAVLCHAALRMCYYVPSGNVTVTVHQINQSWVESTLTGTLSVSSMEQDRKTLEYISGVNYASPRLVNFDITQAVLSWDNGTANNGVAIKRAAGSGTVYFRSYDSGSGYRPHIVYTYQTIATVTAANTFFFRNYYDNSFAEYLALIPWAIQGTSAAYLHQFGIQFARSGNPTYYGAKTDAVLADDSDAALFYQSIAQYFQGLIDEYPSNYRIVFWTNRGANEVTYLNDSYEEKNYNAVVCLHQEGDHNVHNHAIHIMNLGLSENASQQEFEAAMGRLLIHETAHTFDLFDVYNEYSGHELHECIMNSYNNVGDDRFVSFYQEIELGTSSAFCTQSFCDINHTHGSGCNANGVSCYDKLSTLIQEETSQTTF